jgi:hypothetical protein
MFYIFCSGVDRQSPFPSSTKNDLNEYHTKTSKIGLGLLESDLKVGDPTWDQDENVGSC